MKFLALTLAATLSAAGSVALAPHAFPTAAAGVTAGATRPLPARLSETGLLQAGTREAAAEHIAFAPQYPLWTDGMGKRRWLALPPGTFIDASNPDAWQFPVGTRLFKEFATDRAVETRMIERLADGTWRFASYVWNADGSDAELAPEDGAVGPARGLPRDRHVVPSRTDCLACHDAGAGAVLGMSALQLSPDRDPQAPHAHSGGATLRELVERAVVRNLPPQLLQAPARIAAASATERAALGYLHGNCGHCHNDAGPIASLDLSFAQSAAAPQASAQRTLDSLLGRSGRFRAHGATARVVPGQQQDSVIAVRMQSDNPYARMPPLGVQVTDREGLALVERWIQQVQPRAAEPMRHAASSKPRVNQP